MIMAWLVLILITAAVLVFILVNRKKGKDPNHDASVTVEEKAALNTDYLTHGVNNNKNDGEKI
ncbi:hypothetical protein NSQ77_18415 [Oceanobacillus sp. FSL K6-2867]|uniref:hypothetical protein n=1 Tax=Oceanobacillus sp. FSL K6-2867 TaxID=2954748 RepID=UPI0030DAB333